MGMAMPNLTYQSPNAQKMPMTHHLRLSGFGLKFIAMLAMTADHVAWAFVATDTYLAEWLHFVGRLVAPLMAYCLVVGFYHTQDIKAYAIRLGGFAVISQPVYVAYQLAVGGGVVSDYLWQANVLFGLLMALGVLWFWHLPLDGLKKWLIIGALWWCADVADYGRALVLWVLLFDYFYERGFDGRAFGDKTTLMTSYVLSLPVAYVAIYGFYQTVGLGFMHFGMLLTALMILLYDGTKGLAWGGRYLFYVFYPVHLGVIVALKSLW